MSQKKDSSGSLVLLKKNGQNDTALLIAKICDDIRDLLLEKNLAYGDSALNPLRVFSKADTCEQLLVRIDDKLSRIKRGPNIIETDEDVIQDLIGYLVLLKVWKEMNESKEL
tara:strand:+ start:2675 stop:3010 length:336 start_codon:yes stop_codon:yes gene_type:complete